MVFFIRDGIKIPRSLFRANWIKHRGIYERLRGLASRTFRRGRSETSRKVMLLPSTIIDVGLISGQPAHLEERKIRTTPSKTNPLFSCMGFLIGPETKCNARPNSFKATAMLHPRCMERPMPTGTRATHSNGPRTR